MGGKGKEKKKESKLMRCLKAPLRVLGKARDFYTNSLFDCARKASCSSVVCPAPQVPQLPKSFSGASSSEVNKEEVRELVRVVSKTKREVGSTTKVEVKIAVEEEEGMGGGGGVVGMRSYSVGVGRIGRIDEDRPCEFEEKDVQLAMSGELFMCPRTKSYGVRRNIVCY